jgi:hypothetical protein
MNESQYYPDATQRIRDLMRDTFGDYFNVYYLGMPNELIPEAAYPCCIVHKPKGNIRLGATGQDKSASEIQIHFLLNKSDAVNASGDTDVTMRKLQLMVEGRDPTTGSWSKGTALDALRTHLTLGNTNINLDADIEYEVIPTDGDTNISQATIGILTSEIISVNRIN